MIRCFLIVFPLLLFLMKYSIVLLLFSSVALRQFLIKNGLPAFPLVPISSIGAVVGGLIGVSLTKKGQGLKVKMLVRIMSAWLITPIISAATSGAIPTSAAPTSLIFHWSGHDSARYAALFPLCRAAKAAGCCFIITTYAAFPLRNARRCLTFRAPALFACVAARSLPPHVRLNKKIPHRRAVYKAPQDGKNITESNLKGR